MSHEVLFIQGAGETTHDAWDNKLVDSLRHELGAGYDIRYPRMPDEANPDYANWSAALQQVFSKLNVEAIVVGHSIGGTILINMLAEQQPTQKLRAIMLIAAPFVGEGGWPSEDWEPQRDIGSKLTAGLAVYIFHGLADDTAPPSHADLYAREIPQAIVCRLPDRDHQLNNDLREIAAVIKRRK